jgi:MFS family permease
MLGAQAAAVAALLLISGPAGLAVFVIFFGIGFGVLSIARPDLLARYAPRHVFARLSGVQALIVIAAEASGPIAAATLRAATGSYTAVFIAVAVASTALGLLLMAAEHASCPADLPWRRRISRILGRRETGTLCKRSPDPRSEGGRGHHSRRRHLQQGPVRLARLRTLCGTSNGQSRYLRRLRLGC